MKIGFAGLGRMGSPMAARLAAGGHTVVAYDIAVRCDHPVVDTLQHNLIKLVRTPADLAAADISISMLPHAESTSTVLFGSDGIIPAAAEGHIHVVMGTIGPSTVIEFARRAATTGVAIVDSPVSGSVKLAETGQLTGMVGADPETFERVQPMLALMTSTQLHVGAVGSGSAVKVALNTALAALNQAIAEALLIAEAGGVRPADFYRVLQASAVGAPYVDYKREHFLDAAHSGVAFTLELLSKDVTLALDLAAEHHLNLPQARSIATILGQALEAELGHRDIAAVLELLRLTTSRLQAATGTSTIRLGT